MNLDDRLSGDPAGGVRRRDRIVDGRDVGGTRIGI